MPTTGAYEFKLATASQNGVVVDENTIERGEWAWIDRTQEWTSVENQAAGKRRWLMIYCRCPDCGILATVWRLQSPPGHTHEIAADGTLSPSVQCPHAPCGFHTQPTKLLGFVDLR